MLKLVFEFTITSSLWSVRYCSVNIENEPNFLGTKFFWEPIGTNFRVTEFAMVPKNRTDRFGIYRIPRVIAKWYSTGFNF